MNMNEIITGVILSKLTSVSPDNESKKEGISKKINVKVKFDGALLRAVFDKALSGAVIQWANGVGRKGFDKLTDNQTVEIQFTSPASQPTIAPEDAFLAGAKAEGVDITDEKALAAYVIKRMKKAN